MQIRVGEDVYDGLDIENPTNRDAMLIEKGFGGTFMEWATALQGGSAKAMTALVYAAKKKAGDRQLTVDNLEFRLGDVEILGLPEAPAEDDANPPDGEADGTPPDD